MKVAKITLFALLAALVAVGMSTTAYAFHSGGVAECGGCHSMHSPAAGGSFLMVGTDQSSTCLTCHEHAGDTGPSSYHVSTAAADMPAGVAAEAADPGRRLRLAEEDLHLHRPRHHDHRGRRDPRPQHRRRGHRVRGGSDEHHGARAGPSRPRSSRARAATIPHGEYRRLSDRRPSPTTGAPIIGSGSYNNSRQSSPPPGRRSASTGSSRAGLHQGRRHRSPAFPPRRLPPPTTRPRRPTRSAWRTVSPRPAGKRPGATGAAPATRRCTAPAITSTRWTRASAPPSPASTTRT